jgi:CubicO group peptidase (beta-lactamase class C family)
MTKRRNAALWLPVLFGATLGGCAGSTAPAGPTARPAPVDLAQPWVLATPGQAGMDSGLLARAAAEAGAIPRFRSLLVARNGQLVLERYFGRTNAETPFDVRSVTKSVVATLTGVALSEGTLPSLDATVGQYVAAPYALDAGDGAITVRQLLTMTSGYAWDDDRDYNPWILSNDHVQFLLDRPRSGAPGVFTYNSAATHLLGVALQTATRTPLPVFADDRLFHPIGVSSARWEALEGGTVNGGSGIELTARDLLRFGQLLLQEGRSGAREVVPASWIAEMTAPRFSWRNRYGAQSGVTYGYLWWVADSAPTPAFFAWGYGGQFVYVVPSLQLVVVTTTEWRGLGADGTSPLALAEAVLEVVVNDVVAAAR